MRVGAVTDERAEAQREVLGGVGQTAGAAVALDPGAPRELDLQVALTRHRAGLVGVLVDAADRGLQHDVLVCGEAVVVGA